MGKAVFSRGRHEHLSQRGILKEILGLMTWAIQIPKWVSYANLKRPGLGALAADGSNPARQHIGCHYQPHLTNRPCGPTDLETMPVNALTDEPINITDGIPSEIYIGIGRGHYEGENGDYELAKDVADHFIEKMAVLNVELESLAAVILSLDLCTDYESCDRCKYGEQLGGAHHGKPLVETDRADSREGVSA